MNKKIIIFDASTLITLAMNGMFDEVRGLKKIFRGKFIITKEVKKEIIDKPITINRFKLEALKLKQLVDENILEMPLVIGINDEEISKKTTEILDVANNTFQGNNKSIHLIDLGEASCLALSKILNKKGIKSVIAMDERTTRMLGENPESLKKFLQKKLHAKISVKRENLELFKEFKVLRSSELVYIAYKKGLIKLKNGFILDALLYAVKFKGCSISEDEIREIKKLAQSKN
jgi:hypothetical protein